MGFTYGDLPPIIIALAFIIPGLIIYNKTDKNIMYRFYKRRPSVYFQNQPVLMFILALLVFIIAGMSYNVSAILGLAIAAVSVIIIINFSPKVYNRYGSINGYRKTRNLYS